MWPFRADDGWLLGGLSRVLVDTLRGVPMLLESRDERVQKRLLPDTYDDPEDEAQWRRHGAPELERLFASRATLVRKDLDGLRKLENHDLWVMAIPDAHVPAWLATVNAARLALYALNDLEPEHMERGGHETCTPKQQEAILRIHMLAELQGVLLGEFDRDEDEEVEDDGSTAADDEVDPGEDVATEEPDEGKEAGEDGAR